MENGGRDRDGDVSPDGSFTRSLPRGYWGSLDSPEEARETSQVSLPDAFKPLENFPPNSTTSAQKLEATIESRPSKEDLKEMNPWTPGFLARIPRLGFLAMIFNIMSTHTSVRSCSELT
jgi:hypothetical protein